MMVAFKLRKKKSEKINLPPKVVPAKPRRELDVQNVGYRDGGEGMIKWTNKYVYVPIYPEGSDIAIWTRMGNLPTEPNPRTGKSYADIWAEQQKILRVALKMRRGRFIVRQIIFCWPRGEGKSLLACLIQLWKFFNWPRQQIMLGANSRDQIKFVHFDIMRDIIRHSPGLFQMVGGAKNIQEKEIRLKDGKGNVASLIRSISSFSGIVSNITGYTFSEMFDMKNPKFYTQLHGSIRNIPNALGVIDSTVSDKLHILYKLYNSFIMRKSTLLYFSYRNAPLGVMEEYWNPNMDKAQLDDYKYNFPFGEFERYFQNLWEAGSVQVFKDEMIEEIGCLGIDNGVLNHLPLLSSLKEKKHSESVLADMLSKGFGSGIEETEAKIKEIDSRVTKMDSVYMINNGFGAPKMATFEDLQRLSELFDTDWAILAGTDFGDPYSVRSSARTILTVIAKGLVGSRTTPYAQQEDEAAVKYLYCMLHLTSIETHSLDAVKKILDTAHIEYDGIDTFCSERYGAWDAPKWCESRQIAFEPIFPTYDRQREGFRELLYAITEGRFKCPKPGQQGYKDENILKEELSTFQHDSVKKWFGSSEKGQVSGCQDDTIFSINWTIYGGRDLGIEDFRMRANPMSFGDLVVNSGVLGKY